MNEETRNELQIMQSNLIVPKGQYNEFAKFNYRNCEDILQAAKPLLDELGCTLIMSDDVEVIGKGERARFYFVATVTLKSNNGAIWTATGRAREPEERKGMDESQISGAASSYARKYALSGLFLLDDNKDADSVLNLTEAEIDAFTDLVEGEEAAKIFLMQAYDSERYIALSKAAAPKAGKVAFKEKIRELVNFAVASANTTAAYLTEMIDKDDAHGIREAVEELTPDEKKIVWRQLKPDQQDHVKEIMK